MFLANGVEIDARTGRKSGKRGGITVYRQEERLSGPASGCYCGGPASTPPSGGNLFMRTLFYDTNRIIHRNPYYNFLSPN